jgi:subtilase family serine protease
MATNTGKGRRNGAITNWYAQQTARGDYVIRELSSGKPSGGSGPGRAACAPMKTRARVERGGL